MNKITNSITAGIAAMVFVATPLVAGVGSVHATTGNTHNISVPVSTVIYGDEGSQHQLKKVSVEQKYRGMECTVNATARNQHSVHPGNNLVVASGNSSVVLRDVERQGNAVTNADGVLTLGSDVTVTLVMGSDEAFSAGLDVNLTCVEKEVQVCRDGVITTVKESEVQPSDILGSCPAPEFNANIVCSVDDNEAVFTLNINVTAGANNLTFDPSNGTTLPNGDAVDVTGTYNDGTGSKTVTVSAPRTADCTPDKIEVCRDGKVVPIFPNERVDSDADAPCPVPEIEVCRDGSVVTINETDRKDTDTDAPCPQVQGVTTELPKTGAGSIAGVLGATFAGGTAIAQLRMRRSANRG